MKPTDNKPRCDIVIPVWNQPEITKRCSDSIIKLTIYPYRIIFVDNGSQKETADLLKGLSESPASDIILIRNEENAGFARAVNQGIKRSDSEYICVMNNDTFVTKGWLGEMMLVMNAHPKIGLLNPSSNTLGQRPSGSESVNDYAATLKKFTGRIQELYTCRGFCMLIRKKVIDSVGLLDETYGLGYFEETDFCIRAKGESFMAARAKAAYVYHDENVSFKALGAGGELFKRNEKIFFEKWGKPLRIGFFLDRVSRHNSVNDIAINAARAGSQILIFIKRDEPWPVTLDHWDIRRIDLPRVFFMIGALYQIFKRKRKKGLDVIFCDNKILGLFLKMFKVLHGADVYIDPDTETLNRVMSRKRV